jgi:WD40 repeat protein
VLERPARAIAAQGGALIVAAGDELLRWDGRSPPRTLGRAPAPLEQLATAGGLVVSAGADRALAAWRAGSDQPVASYVGHEARVVGLALTADARLAISAGADGTLIAWNLESAAPQRTLPGGGEELCALVMEPGGTALLTAGRQVRAWDLDWEHELPG